MSLGCINFFKFIFTGFKYRGESPLETTALNTQWFVIKSKKTKGRYRLSNENYYDGYNKFTLYIIEFKIKSKRNYRYTTVNSKLKPDFLEFYIK